MSLVFVPLPQSMLSSIIAVNCCFWIDKEPLTYTFQAYSVKSYPHKGELIPQKKPPENCETCEVLTWDDVASSPNLQSKQTQAGDWVRYEGPGESRGSGILVRSRPLWVLNAKDFRDGFEIGYEDLILPHTSLWLLAALINYLMVGSLRVLPWRKISEEAE